MEQVVRLAWQPAGTTFHRYAAHLAKGRIGRARFGTWLVVNVIMDISGDKQVQPAVAIVIAPGCSVRPVAQRHSSLFRNIGKRSVMIVVVETVLTEVGHKYIRPAVIVIVTNGNTESPSVIRYAGFLRNIGKRSVMVVMKQCRMRRPFLAFQCVVGGPVHQVDIEPSIIVVVNQPDARSVRLQNEFLFRSAHDVIPRSQACGLGDIFEDHGPGVDKSASGDGALLGVVYRSECSSRCNPCHTGFGGLRRFLCVPNAAK